MDDTYTNGSLWENSFRKHSIKKIFVLQYRDTGWDSLRETYELEFSGSFADSPESGVLNQGHCLKATQPVVCAKDKKFEKRNKWKNFQLESQVKVIHIKGIKRKMFVLPESFNDVGFRMGVDGCNPTGKIQDNQLPEKEAKKIWLSSYKSS